MPRLPLKGVPGPAAAAATGQPGPAARAKAQLDEAEVLRQRRAYGQAERILLELVEKLPDYVGALHTLGLVLADKGEYAKAMPYLVRASMHNPRDERILTALSGVLVRLDAPEMAARMLDQALRASPGDVTALVTLGEIHRKEREYELAGEAFARALAQEPDLQPARLGYVLCCIQIGEYEKALAAAAPLFASPEHSLNVLFALNALPPALLPPDFAGAVEACVRATGALSDEQETALLFLRATLAHVAGRFADAWALLLEANERKFRKFAEVYERDRAVRHRFVDFIRRYPAPREPVAGREDIPLSLFVLGVSRSGKTTAERLTGAFAGLKRGYENPIVERAVRRTFQTAGLPTADRLVELPNGLNAMFRDFYREDLRLRAGSASAFTNTHPGRIVDVLRLNETVARCRFIFVKRDPMDLALRTFMKNYESPHPYAYDLKTIREYSEWYNALIDIYAERLPGTALAVAYDDVVADPAGFLRRAAELTGLSLQPGQRFETGDDRGCAEPYREWLAKAL